MQCPGGLGKWRKLDLVFLTFGSVYKGRLHVSDILVWVLVLSLALGSVFIRVSCFSWSERSSLIASGAESGYRSEVKGQVQAGEMFTLFP